MSGFRLRQIKPARFRSQNLEPLRACNNFAKRATLRRIGPGTRDLPPFKQKRHDAPRVLGVGGVVRLKHKKPTRLERAMDRAQHLRIELASSALPGVVIGLGMIQMNLIEARRLAALQDELRGVSPRKLTISKPTLPCAQAPELHGRRHELDSEVIHLGARESGRDEPPPVAAAEVDHPRRSPPEDLLPIEALPRFTELRARASPQFARQHAAGERRARRGVGSERAEGAAKGTHAPTLRAAGGLAGAHGNRTHPACARHATAALKAVPDTSPDPLPREPKARPEAPHLRAAGGYRRDAAFGSSPPAAPR